MPDAGEPSRPGVDLIDVQRPKKPKKPKKPKQDVDPFATPKKKKGKKKKTGRGMLQVNREITANEWESIARSVGARRSRPNGRPRVGGGYRPAGSGYRPTRSLGPVGFRRY